LYPKQTFCKSSFKDKPTCCFATVRFLSHSSQVDNTMESTRRIHVCLTCLGEGDVKSKKKLSKKRRWEEKKKGEINSIIPPSSQPHHPTVDKCPTCGGTGVVVTATADSKSSLGLRIPQDFHVAIMGGGIGGLALALACSHRNIPHTIYERDGSFHERAQGYGLTMQQGSKALQALGITTTINRRRKEEGELPPMESLFLPRTIGLHSKRHVVHTSEGQVVGEWGIKVWGPRKGQNEDDIAKRQNAHISRQELRRLLYDAWVASGGGESPKSDSNLNASSLERHMERSIKWGYKFIQYHEDDNNDDDNISLEFQVRQGGDKDDTCKTKTVVEKASVVVGADGIRSSVRQQKMGEQSTPLRYLDCIVILGIAASPSCSTLTSDNETVFQTADGTTRLYVMPFSEKGKETAHAARLWKQENEMKEKSVDTHVDFTMEDENCGETMWQLSFPLSEEDAIRLSKSGPQSLKQEAIRRCGTWHVPIPDLIQQTPEALISGYPVYDRPLLTKTLLREGKSKSIQSRRVTLLGDSAHPMSPFKGQGANVALLDALSLARALLRAIIHDPSDPSYDISSRLENELQVYESSMLQRCEVKVKASAEAAKFLHSEIAILEGNCTRGGAAKAANTSSE